MSGPVSAGIAQVMLEHTPEELQASAASEGVTSLSDIVATDSAFDMAISTTKKAGRNMHLVGGKFSRLVDFGEHESPAALVRITNENLPSKLRVDSYLIKPKKGKKFVLFPYVIAFDESGTLLERLQPLEESRAKGNTIGNVFALPATTRYLLIHSSPATVTWEAAADGKETRKAIRGGLLGAVGGALGGVVSATLDNFEVQRGKVELAPVGVFELFDADS